MHSYPTVTCLHPKTSRRLGDSLTRQSSTEAGGAQKSIDRSLSEFRERNEILFRWNPHGKFLRFNDGNQLVQHLMVNYSEAKQYFQNQDGGFDEILEPHQTLTITGTEQDEDTVTRPRWDVIDFFADIDREVRYVVDWGWVYPKMPFENQQAIIDRYVDRVKWFYEKKAELGLDHVELIPLGKGLHRDHYLRAVEVYDQLGVERIGMYGVQTPSLKTFVWRTEQAIEVFDPEGVLVIGKQSPDDVAQLPDRVDGVAGLRNWKQACNLTADGYSSEGLATWYYNIKEKLRNGRTNRQIGLNTVSHREVKTDG